MTSYKCGHESNGVILLDTTLLAISTYFNWANNWGVFGDKSLCWECYCRKLGHPKHNIKSIRKEKERLWVSEK